MVRVGAAALLVVLATGAGTLYAQPHPPTVMYVQGWNLIGATSGTVISGAVGPLYTYQDGDVAYEAIPAGTVEPQSGGARDEPRAGLGCWAYFPQPTELSLMLAGPRPLPGGQANGASNFVVPIPPQHWVMIGNPFSGSVAVTGADAVYTYDSASGYQPTSMLQPGQGAFAYSVAGGAIDICPANLTCQ